MVAALGARRLHRRSVTNAPHPTPRVVLFAMDMRWFAGTALGLSLGVSTLVYQVSGSALSFAALPWADAAYLVSWLALAAWVAWVPAPPA